MKNTKTTHTK